MQLKLFLNKFKFFSMQKHAKINLFTQIKHEQIFQCMQINIFMIVISLSFNIIIQFPFSKNNSLK
jgi:hypothetical protein